MKTPTLIIATAITLSSQIFAVEPAEETAAIPTGTIEINHAMVRQGVAPLLNWNIEYPSEITDVVDITPDDEIDPKTTLRVQVSMIGVGITDQNGTQYPVASSIRFGSSSWENLFAGRGRDVEPNNILIDRVISPGQSLKFAAKVNVSGYNYFYNSSSNIQVLKNGDPAPSVAAGYDHQTSVATYLRPYVVNGKIKLGPMDLIYVSELTHTNTDHSGYDQQDAIVLVHFDKVTN